MQFTEQQILALAPDLASVKAGRELARPVKWSATGFDGNALWGLCQGSGASPYRTQIDLAGPAFKCSCPSRKFPCKHGLGLLLLALSQPEAVPPSVEPPWVREWTEARAAKEDRTVDAGTERPAPTRTARSEKSIAARESKIAAGLEQLELWLRDLVRSGFAEIRSRSLKPFDEQAARLVDAQAPGLARFITEMRTALTSGAGWEERFLDRLGLTWLLIEAYRRQENLPDDLRSDVRGLMGWNQSQEAVLERDGIVDVWHVVAASAEMEDKLTVQRFWLLGLGTGKAALFLHFVHPAAPAKPVPFAVGDSFAGEVVYYESAQPLRCLVKSQETTVITGAPELGSLADGLAECASRSAALPWLTIQPLGAAAVYPFLGEIDCAGRIVEHETGLWLPLSSRLAPAALWRLVALSGQRPTAIFGEFDGGAFLPLTAWNDEGFVVL